MCLMGAVGPGEDTNDELICRLIAPLALPSEHDELPVEIVPPKFQVTVTQELSQPVEVKQSSNVAHESAKPRTPAWNSLVA